MYVSNVTNVEFVGKSARGQTPAKVKFKAVNHAKHATTKTAIVAAVPGKKIRVLSMNLAGSAADGTATFYSGSTAITGLIPVDIDAVQPMMGLSDPHGLMETAVGEAFQVLTDASMDLDGVISYVEV